MGVKILKLNLKYLLLLPILLIFLPSFAIYLGKPILLYIITTVGLLFLVFLINFRKIKNKLYLLYKRTPFKYYIWTIILMIINSIGLHIISFSGLKHSIYAIFMFLLCSQVFIIFYFLYIIGNQISFKKFMKVFIFLFWLNLIIGIISWIGSLLEINIINNIFDFFANSRILADANNRNLVEGSRSSNYSSFGLPRLDNLFEEPSYYALFLFSFLPLVYEVARTKIKIFKNDLLNKSIKISIIPLTWLSLVLTMSPIYLVFSILLTIVYFFNEIFHNIKKNLPILLVGLLFIVTLFFIIMQNKIDVSNTYLSRITSVYDIKTFEQFIEAEPSLASRVALQINTYIIFFKHIFTGVGYGHFQYAIIDQLLNSPVPLTKELIVNLNIAIATNSKMHGNTAIIAQILAENGIFIFCIFVYFYYKLISELGKLAKEKILSYKTKMYLKIMRNCLFACAAVSIYSALVQTPAFIIIITLSICIIYYSKRELSINKRLLEMKRKEYESNT